MNFKTRQAYNNRLLFVYGDGEVRQTGFTEVAFYGDNYLLAKGGDSLFYTILDLDGNEVKGYDVVHRFENGLLLTYTAYDKEYVSSDKCHYTVNYNVYSVLNYATRKSYVINIIQSDSMFAQDNKGKVLHNKTRKTVIKDFLNKPVYSFGDFIFTEMIDSQYVLTGNVLSLSRKSQTIADFDLNKDKKIWSVIDILDQTGYNYETSMKASAMSSITFKDAELCLSELVTIPDQPVAEDYACSTIFSEAVTEYNLYSSWRSKSKWQKMMSNLMHFTKS